MPGTHRSEIASDALLTLVTLGNAALQAVGTSGPVTVFEIGKPVALVTYLACAPARTASREHLLDLLWGDVERIATWDHVTGGLPEVAGRSDMCRVWFPGSREGAAYGDSIGFAAGATRITLRVPDVLSSGEWFDARLQLLPDGRCAFALNGVPLVVSAHRAFRVPVARLVLSGNSEWTKILVGETTLREGVADDIDWSKASLGNVIVPTSRRAAGTRE
jgi:hypothetical protein